MSSPAPAVGLSWRPETAWLLASSPEIGVTEVIAENVNPDHPPPALMELRGRGMTILVHGLSLSLGGAQPPDRRRLDHLARVVELLEAPFVSEHVALVRAGGLDSGHLLPLPRTREQLDILIENVLMARRALPVPLALENIASLVEWPDPEMDEPSFLHELLERTDCGLLLDLSNLHAGTVNHGWNAAEYLDRLPLRRLRSTHMAGGHLRGGLWHDTHAHPLGHTSLELLKLLAKRVTPPVVILERDANFTTADELQSELASIRAVLEQAGRHAHAA
ncbi:MAG: hypothetical protein GMKNLPBB_02362 [Myxococcota bacterium]|nr:hypothetical protein [Myxococcota bacterium]